MTRPAPPREEVASVARTCALLTAQVHARLAGRVSARAGVPDREQVPRPALAWAGLATALALGGALATGPRVAGAVFLAAVAWTRPVARPAASARLRWWLHAYRRPLVWLLLAATLLVGGARVAALERGARPGPERPVEAEAVTLTQALPAAAPGGQASSARGLLGGRPVELVAPRFGSAAPAVPRGGVARVTGRVVPLGGRPGDERLRRSGVTGRLLATEVQWQGGRRGGLLGAVDHFADASERRLVAALGRRRGALVAGMALGSADGIGETDADALRTSGLWHLVAASGGNIALVVALVMVLGWLVGAGDRTRLAVAALAVCAYVPLAGAGPSIQRAGVMGLAGLLALALGREHRGATALALAATATLALDPRAWLDVGWQLSFAAAGGLIAAAPWAARRLGALGAPRWLAAGLACTLVATVATAPIMLLTFGELSLIGLVANALVLPLVGVAVWSGALAALLGPIAPAVAAAAAQPGGVAAGLTLSVATWSSARTHATITAVETAALLVALALVAVVRPPPVVTGGLLVAALAALVWSVPGAPREPRLLVLDIGQGNAALLQDGGDAVLVDAGPADGGLVTQLRRAGVRRLRAVVLSHPAADHDGGAAAAIRAFPTDLVLDGGEPGGGPTHDADLQAARERGARVVPARAGQQVRFGRVALRLRWPTPAATRRPGDPNDRAAVVEAQVGGFRALLPADAEGNVLRVIPHLLRADVLIVSHHGSTDEELPATLKRVQPALAVISVGAHNTYGHPTHQALQSLRDARVPTLRTDQVGTVDVRAGPGGGIVVRREGAR